MACSQGRKRHHRLAKASVARSDLRRGIVPLTICDGLGSMPKCFACGNPSEIQESSDSCFSEGFPALTFHHPKSTNDSFRDLSTNEIGGNIMGYAVDYIPTSEQKRRKVKKKYRREHVTSKAIRAKDMKKAVKWNLPKLEYDTTGADTVDRSIAIRILHLDCISRDTDPDGDHAMQQLVSEGIVSKPKRVGGHQVFDRADLIQSLKEWTR